LISLLLWNKLTRCFFLSYSYSRIAYLLYFLFTKKHNFDCGLWILRKMYYMHISSSNNILLNIPWPKRSSDVRTIQPSFLGPSFDGGSQVFFVSAMFFRSIRSWDFKNLFEIDDRYSTTIYIYLIWSTHFFFFRKSACSAKKNSIIISPPINVVW
jgi:hypothetical protein